MTLKPILLLLLALTLATASHPIDTILSALPEPIE